MAESAKKPGLNLPWMPIITVVAGLAASGLLVLSSSRPTDSAQTGAESTGAVQDIDARLWQDPFTAVSNHEDAGTKFDRYSHSIERMRTEIAAPPTPPATWDEPLILAVMVNASAYPEKLERRLRDRVAVGSGLARCGYVAKDAEHLGCFTIPWPRQAAAALGWKRWVAAPAPDGWERDGFDYSWDADDNDSTWLNVPFEVYDVNPLDAEAHKLSAHKIIVLWLRDENFADDPLLRLAGLCTWFQRLHEPATAAPLTVLGPDGSTTLRSLLQNLPAASSEPVKALLSRVTMLSCRSTASDAVLLKGIPHGPADDTVKKVIEAAVPRLHFFRTIPTDKVVLQEAIRELQRRQIFPGQPAGQNRAAAKLDPVALISEWDSFYGRALPEAFHQQLPDDARDDLQLLTYLRGIDGHVPGEKAASPKNAKPGGSDPGGPGAAAKEHRPREIPEGTDQSDYLRRLAERLEDWDQALLDDPQTTQKGIRAVGVIGSDVYDKLQILRALRPGLSGALFFTTGLDARFYHPDELSATQNLVVVSAFGLSLSDAYQGPIPPFRDSYQTATFAATLCALGAITDYQQPDFFEQLRPRIFEIGSDGLVDLSPEPGPAAAGIHPPRARLHNWGRVVDEDLDWHAGASLAGLALLAALIFFARRCIFKKSGAGPFSLLTRSTAVFLPSAMVATCAILWPLYRAQRDEGEPWALFSGVSMWPTEAIRLMVFFLSIHFMLKIAHRLRKNARQVADAFDLPGRATSLPGWHTCWRTWDSCIPPGHQKIEDLWLDYLAHGKGHTRTIWAGIFWAGYVVAIVLLSAFCRQPHLPGRGSLIFTLDHVILIFAVLFSNFLTLFVVHATLLEGKFIALLQERKPVWSPATLARHRREPGAGQDYLAHHLDLRLVAQRSEVVTELIYYPCITIALLIVCRLPQFDHWDWPPLLVLIFTCNIAMVCGCAWVLRHLAERLREKSIERLRDALCDRRARGDEPGTKAIAGLIEEAETLHLGIFAPISHQPIVGALLLPSGGAGVWGLLQYFQH